MKRTDIENGTARHTPGALIRVLGITGRSGSGKSTVLELMRDHFGAEVILCDEEGRQAQRKGGECYAPLLELLGKEVLLPDGELNRAEVARMIHEDPQTRRAVDEIVHPAVTRRVAERIRQAAAEGKAPFAVVESAILFEAGLDSICDEVWYVSAPDEVTQRRLMLSRGYSEERIRGFRAIQKNEKELAAACALRLDNSGDGLEKLLTQIDKGLRTHGFLYDSQREQR